MINIIWIFIFIIILIIAFSINYFFYSNIEEKFETPGSQIDYTTDKADISQYKYYGNNRCSIFELDPTKVDSETYIMSRELIETNRIKELTERNTDDTTFCYIYDDKDRQIQDFILSEGTCSIKSPIFANNDMIKNVFTDSNADKIHTYPIKKCIIEIDNSKVTNDNLKKFYNSIKDSYCTNMASDILTDILKTQEEFQLLSNKYADLDMIYNSNNEMYKNTMYEYDTCTMSNNKYTYSNNYILNQNNYISTKNFELENMYNTCSNNLYELLTSTSNAVESLLNDNIKSRKMLDEVSKNVDSCQLTNQNINDNIDRKKNTSGILAFTINNMYNNNAGLILSNIECQGELNKIISEADMYMEKYNQCYSNIELYHICNSNYTKCIKERQVCHTERDRYEEIYKHYDSSNISCGYELKNTIFDLDSCREKERDESNKNNQYRTELERLDEIINTLISQRDSCTVNLANRITFKNELDKRTIELRSDKEYYKDSFKDVEKNKTESSIELMKSRIKVQNKVTNIPLITSDIPNTVRIIDVPRRSSTSNDPYYFEDFNNRVIWNNAVIVHQPRFVDIGGFPSEYAQWIWSNYYNIEFTEDDAYQSKQNTHNIHQFQMYYDNKSPGEVQVNYYAIANDSGLLWFNYNDYARHNKNLKHNVEQIELGLKVRNGTYMLRPGINTITINAINREIYGGVLFVMIDPSTGKELLKTDDQWKCHIMRS